MSRHVSADAEIEIVATATEATAEEAEAVEALEIDDALLAEFADFMRHLIRGDADMMRPSDAESRIRLASELSGYLRSKVDAPFAVTPETDSLETANRPG